MFQESYEINVHAGAHCCGAEDFQRFLGANRAALSAIGYDLVYPGRTGAVGGSFDGAYPEPGDAAAEIEAFAAPLARTIESARQGGRALLLSEHDLAGRMGNLLGGRFYPAARQRARALGQALGQPVDRLVLTVKSYDALFLSAWRQFALDRKMEPFIEFVPAMAGFSGGWVDVVEALRDGLGARHVVILPKRPDPQEMLAHLAPRARLPQPAIPDPAPPITESAIAMIQRHHRQGVRFAPGQRDRLLAFHARLAQVPGEKGFAGLQLADLRGRYVADLDTLARMKGVEVIGSLMPAMAAE